MSALLFLHLPVIMLVDLFNVFFFKNLTNCSFKIENHQLHFQHCYNTYNAELGLYTSGTKKDVTQEKVKAPLQALNLNNLLKWSNIE